jgi:N-acetylglucosamine kinase-like BadF-type ATPase
VTACPADEGEGEREEVIVGIDAGGSSTRARAVKRCGPVFEGVGGPGNPVAANPEAIRASYQAALDGCPAATRVAACVSGGGGEAARAQIADLLAHRFPGASVHVAPDYVAAFAAASPGRDLCIVAGTGSVVCSRGADGSFRVSGGRGWILGDHGGAARLGRAALEHYVADIVDVPASFAAAVRELFGDDDWRSVVRAVHAAPNPAPLLAKAAPLLTGAAESGQQWAIEQLSAEMSALAATAARHIDQYLTAAAGTDTVDIALSGGIWSSAAARSALDAALRRASDRALTVTRSLADPLAGAVRLAETFPL